MTGRMLPKVLLLEPQFVLRRTLAAAARQLAVADVHEATSLHAAARLASLQRYDLAMLAVEVAPPHDIEAFVRSSGAVRVIGLVPFGMPGAPSIPGVHQWLHKPLKVKDLLRCLQDGAD